MQKVVAIIQFRKDMSREEAMRPWREVHGPIGRKVPGLRKYVQNHSAANPVGELQFDGIVELWFDSAEAYQAATASPEWAAAMADLPNFVDTDKIWGALVDEVPIV